MAEEIATLPRAPELPKGGRLGFKEALGVQEPFMQRKAELQPQITAAEGEIAKATQAQSEVLAGGKEKAVQQFATEEKGAKEAYQAKLEAEPLPAFIPTKDTVQDIAGLFSVIGVIGMLVGGGGKMAGQRAMGAMNGMLEGHRKGRADLYKKERNEFDANFKTMLSKHQEFRKEMEDAVKLAATNKEAGFAAAELAATKAGSDIVKAQLRKGDLAGAYKLVDESQKGAQEALRLEGEARKGEAAEKRHRESMAQRERMEKERNALREKLSKAAAEAKGKGGTLKPGAKITEGYVADTILRADVDGLRKDLENPKLQELITKYRAEAFLTEESKVLNQLISSDIPAELQQFLTKVRDIRNNYYLNISGKAVTGGEALRNYGTVPQPGDDFREMQNKLLGMSGRISDSISLKQQLFGLPELNLRPGTRPNLKPGEDYAIGGQPGKYELNQVITQGGKKYRVVGLDDPSDPDLEEIE
jgi:hypothetical protein